jgi:ABC-2 type transport system permease protein
VNGGRVLAITRKTFLTLRHDPRSVALILLAPIMAMLVFGFAFGTEVSHVRTVVVNEDQGAAAAEVIGRLDRDALDITVLQDAEEGRRMVREGEAAALLAFPANFTADGSPTPGAPPLPPRGARVEAYLDATNSQQAAVVQRTLAQAIQSYAESRGGKAPIAVEPGFAYAEGARFIDFFVPGIMAFAALLFTTLLTLLAFVGERASGTLDRLRVTPATEAEIVLGYATAFGVIGAVQGVILLTAALLLFHVLVVGNVLLAGLVLVLLAIDSQAIGILVSSAAKREGQAIMMVPFILLPTMLLSGIFVSTESLPGWLRPLAYALPPTWAVQAMRDVMLRGWGLDRVWPALAALAGFAVLFISLAVVGLRRARA